MTEKVGIEINAEEIEELRSKKIEDSEDLSAERESAKTSDAQISDETAQVIDKNIDDIDKDDEIDEGDEGSWQQELVNLNEKMDRIEKLLKYRKKKHPEKNDLIPKQPLSKKEQRLQRKKQRHQN